MTPIVTLYATNITNFDSERLITNFRIILTVAAEKTRELIPNARRIYLRCIIRKFTHSSRGALNLRCHSNLISSFSSSSFDFSLTRPGGGSYMKLRDNLSLLSFHNKALCKNKYVLLVYVMKINQLPTSKLKIR